MKAKGMKRIFSWLAVLALACFVFPAPLYASESAPVAVDLTSDADAYDAGAEAELQVTVTNEGDATIDASWQLTLPEGVTLLEGQSDSGNMDSLAPGEGTQANVRVKMPEAQGAFVVGSSSADSSDAPDAGDWPVSAVVLLALAGVAAAIAAVLGRKRLRGPLCVLLAVIGVFSVGFTAAGGVAYADQTGSSSASATHAVSVDGRDLTFGVAVSYEVLSGEQPGGSDDPGSPEEPTGPDKPVNPDEPNDPGVPDNPDDPAISEDPVPSGGDGIAVDAEYQDDVLVFDDYELTDEGYVISAEAVEQAVENMEARGAMAAEEAMSVAKRGVSARAAFAAPAHDNENIREGAMCAFVGNEGDPAGAAGVVTKVEYRTNELHKPEFLVKLQQTHDPNDVLSKFSVSAQRQAIDMSRAEFAEGVSAESDPSDLLKLNLKVDKKLSSGDELKLSLWLKPVLDADIDWSSGAFQKCLLRVGLEGEAEGSANVKGVEEEIPLLKKPFVQQLGYGLNVAFNVNLKLSCDGSASIGIDIENVWGVEYRDGAFKDVSTSSAKFVDPSIEGTAKLGVQPYFMLRLLNIEIVDAGLELGGAATGSVTTRPTGMVCTDRAIYLYAEFSVGENTDWLKKAGISGGPWVIWDEDNSPLPMHEHLEDGTPVDSCTYEPESPEPSEPQEPTPAEDFEWSVFSGSKVIIEGYLGNDTSLVIPAEIEGNPVVEVWFDANSYSDRSINHVKSIALEEGSQVEIFEMTEYGFETGHDDPEENPNQEEWLALSDVDLSASDRLKDVSTGYRMVNLKVNPGNIKYLCSRINANEIDLADYPVLETADLYKSSFKSIKTQGASSALRKLNLTGTNITSIDLSPIPQLEYLVCDKTQLTSLDVSACKSMWGLDCSNGVLTELIIGDKSEIENGQFSLYCSNNKLTELDLSGVPKDNLVEVQCGGNMLTDLDLEDCINLGLLECQDNQLETLIVRGCSNLSSFDCSNNELAELDLSGCVDMQILTCSDNKLTAIDITPCYYSLDMVNASGNQIEDTTALKEWGSQYGHHLTL